MKGLDSLKRLARERSFTHNRGVTRVSKRDRRRFAEARQRGRRDAARPTAVVDARYDFARASFEFTRRDARAALRREASLPSSGGSPLESGVRCRIASR